jgi:CheY-like chemotaxis protein
VIEQAAADGCSLAERMRAMVSEAPAPSRQALSLESLIRDTAERATPRIHSRRAESPIDVVVEPKGAALVIGDPGELRQVLTNLLYNAVDALPHGGKVALRCGVAAGEAWAEVEDNGAGMDAHTRERIFEPYFTTKGARGTGLGLSVCRQIVAGHGGRIELDSELGRGTRIRVVLPAHLGGRRTSSPPPISMAEPITARIPLKAAPKASILVIDDDLAVRDVLTEILRTDNYDVVAAASGPDGIALLGTSRFDLVFTDLGMPGMNGWEVAADIRAKAPGTAIGVITGWESQVDRARLNELGIDLVVPKPFRFQQVLDIVSRTLAARRAGGRTAGLGNG